jgi:hypothetical protein
MSETDDRDISQERSYEVEFEECVGRTPNGGYVYRLKGGGYFRYPDDFINFLDFRPKPKNRSADDPPCKLTIEPLTIEEYWRALAKAGPIWPGGIRPRTDR